MEINCIIFTAQKLITNAFSDYNSGLQLAQQ